jgi:hypothetical protein
VKGRQQEGEERVRRVERMELHLYIWQQQHEAHQTLHERGRREYNGGVNLFKVHCTQGWNYHNETPLCY